MVNWAKENAVASGLKDAPIRWLVDDCVKFVEREIRRGNHYDGIIMDPPSYGRGPKGRSGRLEESIHPFIRLCSQLLSDDPLFFLVKFLYDWAGSGGSHLYDLSGVENGFTEKWNRRRSDCGEGDRTDPSLWSFRKMDKMKEER